MSTATSRLNEVSAGFYLVHIVVGSVWNAASTRHSGIHTNQFAALSRFTPGLNGFRHAELRTILQTLLGGKSNTYTASQMSYDLRRLRLKGLVARIEGTHQYILTTYGRKVAYLMTKLQRRIFDVASAAIETTEALPSQLARAFRQLDTELEKLVADAQLAPAKT